MTIFLKNVNFKDKQMSALFVILWGLSVGDDLE